MAIGETSKAIDKPYLEKQFQDYTEQLKENFVDSELNADSTNPVQNKIVTEAINGVKYTKNLIKNGGPRRIVTINNEMLSISYDLTEEGIDLLNKSDVKITMSFDAKKLNSSNVLVNVKLDDGKGTRMSNGLDQLSLSTSSQRLRFRLVSMIPSSYYTPKCLTIYTSNNITNTIDIENVKVELGYIDNANNTYWTPTPEDFVSEVDFELDEDSTNPVENRVITKALNDLKKNEEGRNLILKGAKEYHVMLEDADYKDIVATYDFSNYAKKLSSEEEKTFTVSLDVMTKSGIGTADIRIIVNYQYGDKEVEIRDLYTPSYERINANFNLSEFEELSTVEICVFNYDQILWEINHGDVLDFKNVKVELGNVEDPQWSPAPEDYIVEVDSELSLESENPVQNRVITKALNDLKEDIPYEISHLEGGAVLESRIDWLNKRGVAYNDSPSNAAKPWYKVGAILPRDVTGTFIQISFKVNNVYTNENIDGILTAIINPDSPRNAKLMWEYAVSDIQLDDFILAYNVTNGVFTCELWCKIEKSYRGYMFEVLSEGNQGMHKNFWTLYEPLSGDSVEEPTPGYTKVPSTLMTLANPAKIDGIVGGRNLILDSGMEQIYTMSGNGVNTGITDYFLSDYGKQILNIVGTKVVVSFDAKSDDVNQMFTVRFRTRVGGSTSDDTVDYKTIEVSQKFKRYYLHFEIKSEGSLLLYFVLTSIQNIVVNTVHIKNVKVELGEVATDYTPAPEDYYAILDASDMTVEQRRNTFRGKNLGSVYTDAQKAQVAAGTFKDLFIGDYWVINGVTWRIVDINYWLNTGENPFATPHLVIMPDKYLYVDKMNSEETVDKGYTGSEMYNTGLDRAKEMVNSAFGANYILSHREYLTNAVKDGHASGNAWFDSTVELPNEPMIYGSYIFVPRGDGSSVPSCQTIDNTQLALFRMYPLFIKLSRTTMWLRDVVSVNTFAFVSGTGNASAGKVIEERGVRPVFGVVGTPAA